MISANIFLHDIIVSFVKVKNNGINNFNNREQRKLENTNDFNEKSVGGYYPFQKVVNLVQNSGININLRGTFLCSKYAIPHLRRTRGCIVNVSSMVGLVGQGNAGAYSASKGGQIAMTKGMALDFAPDGIRVNAICPGWIQTPLVEDWFGQQKDPAASRAYIYGAHPLGRIGTAEECGRAALYLASDDAAFVTGIVLPVEGGITLGY